MEHRALSWLKREYRHDVFRLIATSGVNPRVFFFRKNLKSGFNQGADLASLVDGLLKIDFESFFLEMAKLNRAFREKYPVPREPWLDSRPKARITWPDGSPISCSMPSSLEGQFRRSVKSYCDGFSLPGREEENRQRISDYEAFVSRFFSILVRSSDGDPSVLVKEQLYELIEFSFVDDLWLSLKGENQSDAELFELWAVECERINKVFRVAVQYQDISYDVSNFALSFDQMVGIEDIPHGDFRRIVGWKGETNLPVDPNHLERRERKRNAWYDPRVDLPFSGSGVGVAISGLVWLECSKLRLTRSELHADVDEMGKIFKSFLCASSDESMLFCFQEVISLGCKVLADIENYESKIGRAKERPLSFSLMRLLLLAKKYLGICNLKPHQYFPHSSYLVKSLKDGDECIGKVIDTDFQFELLAVYDAWSNYCREAEIESFPSYYARILSAALHAGLTPKKCKHCGGLFFPEAPNQQYCKRVIRESGVKCSDVGQRASSGEKRSFNNKLQSVKGKARRSKGKSLTAQSYYEDLADYIQNEAGPLYRVSELVDCATYDEWLEKVIGPKSGALTQLRVKEYPYPLIWNGRVEDGTSAVDVSNALEKYPLFVGTLNVSGWNSAKLCNPETFSDGPVFQAAWVLRSVIRFNREHPDMALPIPGLVDCDLFRLCSEKRRDGLQNLVRELDSETEGRSAQDKDGKACRCELER